MTDGIQMPQMVNDGKTVGWNKRYLCREISKIHKISGKQIKLKR